MVTNQYTDMNTFHPSMMMTQQQQQPATCSVSFSRTGLSISTNVVNAADVYRILLGGVSQMSINKDSTMNIFSTESIKTINEMNQQQFKKGNGKKSIVTSSSSSPLIYLLLLP